MFSKIGDMLKVNPPAQDGGRKDGNARGQQPYDNQKGGREESRAPFSGDSVLLSLDALRAIAKSQALPEKDMQSFEAALARLSGHGLSRIPLRSGQSAAEAVIEALSFLSSARE